MVRDLNFPVEIIPGPIVREADGLAMSSRNVYLSPTERRDALALRRALDLAERLYAEGERSPERVTTAMKDVFAAVPSARVDYISLVNWQDFTPAQTLSGDTLIALAVFIGKTRLIDNTRLGSGDSTRS